MFLTLGDAKIRVPFPMADLAEHYWSSVQIRIHVPWFFVSYEDDIDEQECGTQSAILVMHFRDVIEIAALVKVLQIAMISPSRNDSDGRWKFDSLKELWVGTEPFASERETAVLYVTEDVDAG